MTRAGLRSRLRNVVCVLVLLIVAAAFCRVAPHLPGFVDGAGAAAFKDIYRLLVDTSVISALIAAIYVSYVLQRRIVFIAHLREAWRDVVAARSALTAIAEQTYPDGADYQGARAEIARAIETVGAVYADVPARKSGQPQYPFAPLHDMRRALETLDPRANRKVTDDDRTKARSAIGHAFDTLRVSLCEEFDRTIPTRPITAAGRAIKAHGDTDTSGRAAPETVGRYLEDLAHREAARAHVAQRRSAGDDRSDTTPSRIRRDAAE